MTDTDSVANLLSEAMRRLRAAKLTDFNGHISTRSAEDRIVLTGSSTPEDAVELDLSGAQLGTGGRRPLEFPIHTSIYRTRQDVQVVLHTHPFWSTILTSVGVRYGPVFPQGSLLGDIPIFESPLSINTGELGDQVAGQLGDLSGIFLKSHGAIIVGQSVPEVFALCKYVEENARRQVVALQIGTPYILNEQEQDACFSHLWKAVLFEKAWNFHAD